MESYVKNRDKNRIQRPPNAEGKRRLRDYVIDTKTREGVYIFDHKDVIRTGFTVSRNLKRIWWLCYDCRLLYFLAYEDEGEAK
jgi:hypothetical protein